MLGYHKGNNVPRWGAVDSRGGRGWLLAAVLRPTTAMSTLAHPPTPFSNFSLRKRGPCDPGRGYFWTWWRSRHGQFQGLTVVAMKMHCSDFQRRAWLRTACCQSPGINAVPFLKEVELCHGWFLLRTLHQPGWNFLELSCNQRLFFSHLIFLFPCSSQVSVLHDALKVLPTFSTYLLRLFCPQYMLCT